MSKSPGSQSVSIHDVAKALKVSTATVSRAFTPGASISEKTRDKVMAMSQQLGYQPNIIAKMLNTRTSRIVGLITGSLDRNPYYNDFIASLSPKLQASGYQLMIFTAHDDTDISDSIVQALQYQVEAIIIANAALSPETTSRFINKPIIVVGPPQKSLSDTGNIHYVAADNHSMGQQAADILQEKGYQLVHVLAGQQGNRITQQRAEACIESLTVAGIDSIFSEIAEDSYSAAYQAGKTFSCQRKRGEAVFCTSDIVAMGFIDGVRASGKFHIPNDLGVLSLDGISPGLFAAYSLSTIGVPFDKEACRIVEIIQGKFGQQDRIHLFPGKVIHGSTLH